MLESYDVVVVGSGFCGSLLARKFAGLQHKKVAILERRHHIAGNMFDQEDENGILIQRYGPHTFHTNQTALFDEIKKYSEWIPYQLTCRAMIHGISLPIPFNYTSIDRLFLPEKAALLKNRLESAYLGQSKATILELLSAKDPLIKEYADLLFEEDYRPYTAKQWGIEPAQIDPTVLQRVPVLFSYDDGYFPEDEDQYMPKHGFTTMFQNVLNHPGITVYTDTEALDYITVDEQNQCVLIEGKKTTTPVIFTGAVDQLFHYKYGRLPYRSLRFEYQTHMVDSYQDAPVVAHPKAEGFTRITEYKKIPIQAVPGVTTIAIEYPLPIHEGDDQREPYYPILTKESREKYQKYANDARAIRNLVLCGRLADFKYYNMDNAIERTLSVWEKLSNKDICI